MRRSALADALADEHGQPRPTADRSAGPSPAEERLVTEFPFVLPRGYVDSAGTVHRDGVMRLATARDELVPLRDDRVRENPAYLTVVLLGRVVTRLGTITDVHAGDHREPVRRRPGVPAGPLPPGQPGGSHPRRRHLPRVRPRVRRRPRRWAPGGIVTYAADTLYEEVAYVAYHFHWSREEILDLEHPERREYVGRIARLNTRGQRGERRVVAVALARRGAGRRERAATGPPAVVATAGRLANASRRCSGPRTSPSPPAISTPSCHACPRTRIRVSSSPSGTTWSGRPGRRGRRPGPAGRRSPSSSHSRRRLRQGHPCSAPPPAAAPNPLSPQPSPALPAHPRTGRRRSRTGGGARRRGRLSGRSSRPSPPTSFRQRRPSASWSNPWWPSRRALPSPGGGRAVAAATPARDGAERSPGRRPHRRRHHLVRLPTAAEPARAARPEVARRPSPLCPQARRPFRRSASRARWQVRPQRSRWRRPATGQPLAVQRASETPVAPDRPSSRRSRSPAPGARRRMKPPR